METLADLLFIFVLRLLDVAMSTVRIVLLGKSRKGASTILGFFESLIWVIAITRVLDGIDDPLRMIAFAAGFAAGTYVGALVEEWLALGQSLIRVIAQVDSPPVAARIRELGFGATVVNGDGLEGEVRVTFSIVPRKRTSAITREIHDINPEAFVTVESTTSIDAPRRQDRAVQK